MTDPVVTEVKAAVAADVAAVKAAVVADVVADVPTFSAKVVAYVKAHATPTVVGTLSGYAAAKFGIISLLLKIL